MDKKLYIEYRVYVDPTVNQEFLSEVADKGQEAIYDLFTNACGWDGKEFPTVSDVTYEVVMEVPKPKLIIHSDFEFRQEPK
jgi:hypothetical protein